MTLFQDPDAVPRTPSQRLGDVLEAFAAAGDLAARNAPGTARRKAAAAASLARSAGRPDDEIAALYYAGLLHAAGALGDVELRRDAADGDRAERMARWDIPAEGARLCARIAALPAAVSDLVRWQDECWDGTGYPDQLRWNGIPAGAQLLRLADLFARAADPEETLQAVADASGRTFGPEIAAGYLRWFHLTGGEGEAMDAPVDALRADATDPEALVDLLADRIDARNGTPGRRRRIGRIVDAVAARLGISPADASSLALASRIFATGDLAGERDDDGRFDPLARLGIAERARNAAAAADAFATIPTFAGASAAVRMRAAWFDGTGTPAVSHEAIPIAARVLSAAIAYDALEAVHRTQIREDRTSPADRLDDAAGTQFDPTVARTLLEVAGMPA